jgi:hypothetical protein
MKAEISGYFRTRADALMDRARENPLQTAAIGIGVGYPLLKIARSIPAPILMVGAGLYLLGTSSGQKLSDTVSKKVAAAAEGVSDSFNAGVDVAKQKVHDTHDLAASGLASARDTIASNLTQQVAAVGSSLNQLKDSATDLAGSASDSAAGLTQRAVGALGATSDAMGAGVARTGSIVRDRAGDAAEFGTKAAEFGTNAGLKLRDQAVDASINLRVRAVATSHKVGSGMSDVIHRNPLLFGGLGLTVGMLIASALPKSDIEKNIMGHVSADVRKRANELASKQFDTVKGLASEALDDLADHASQEGIMPADLNAATEDLGRRVRKVAESATEAAFGRADDKTYRNEKTVDAI